MIQHVKFWRQQLSSALESHHGSFPKCWMFHDTDGSIWHAATVPHYGGGGNICSELSCPPSAPQNACSAWIPFIQFLRNRRSKVIEMLKDDRRFPLWMIEQVSSSRKSL
jgi:hypothetical protein